MVRCRPDSKMRVTVLFFLGLLARLVGFTSELRARTPLRSFSVLRNKPFLQETRLKALS